ncbi:hypothetical protein CEXT_752731 [Caerostris extrusa]|uniref:Secreted protein n=1 Tax=Caerostris extrusa TaxID=172846 RepID=A0AAV4WWD1_CAEEX|nr:hypothetical protein CEXT_752731 [Caerostris extrusa]
MIWLILLYTNRCVCVCTPIPIVLGICTPNTTVEYQLRCIEPGQLMNGHVNSLQKMIWLILLYTNRCVCVCTPIPIVLGICTPNTTVEYQLRCIEPGQLINGHVNSLQKR